MQKIVPHLWFDKEATEAAEFYVSVFSDLGVADSKVNYVNTLHDTPSGDCDVVSFTLGGFTFAAISAGPLFALNPSISFSINCRSKDEVDAFWQKLSPGGKALMELGEYPFAERYGWLNDKYGVSWQIISMEGLNTTQKITPAFMFTQNVCGKAEEAVNFYASVFHNTKVGEFFRYPKDQKPEKEGTIAHVFFTLEGQEFAAMDSAREHAFIFNEAASLMVRCETQEEIDYYWEKLIADGGEESVCGWLKDKYGVSWQIVPSSLDRMIQKGTPEQVARVTQAFLKMKKFDVAELQRQFEEGPSV